MSKEMYSVFGLSFYVNLRFFVNFVKNFQYFPGAHGSRHAVQESVDRSEGSLQARTDRHTCQGRRQNIRSQFSHRT